MLLLSTRTVLLLWLSSSYAFNLDSSLSFKTIRSPIVATYTIDNAGVPPSSFFGYNLRMDSQDSLKVSAPKTVSHRNPFAQSNSEYPEARGNVLSCPISFSSSSNQACVSQYLPSAELGDSFGLSLGITPANKIIACSPSKIQTCRVAKHSPGYCYQNSGNASNWEADFRTRNEYCRLRFLDLIFLLDASGSIKEENFTIVKNWTKQVASNFDISDSTVQIGVIRYSDYNPERPLNDQLFVNTEIALGSIRNRTEFNTAVDAIERTEHQTYTSHALNKSVIDFRSSDGFNQPNTAKVLVLLTDGRSTDRQFLEASASYVRSLNVTTFAVGVGEADINELRIIATGNNASDVRVFNVSNFNLLSGIVDRLGDDIRSAALEGAFSNTNETDFSFEYGEYGFSIEPSNKPETKSWMGLMPHTIRNFK